MSYTDPSNADPTPGSPLAAGPSEAAESTVAPATAAIEMWGGVECTVNRVRDDYFTQLERSGHCARDDDLERFAALGVRALRYPVLWERTAPDGLASADWSWPE